MQNILKLLVICLCLTFGSEWLNASELRPGIYNTVVPTGFGWILSSDEGMLTLEVYTNAGKKLFTKYDVSECRFCEGEDDNCDIDGIFSYAHAYGPMIGMVCHKGAHSQRFSLFSPLQDPVDPLMQVIGNYYVQIRLDPLGIEVTYDEGEDKQDEHKVWPSTYKPVKPVLRQAKHFVRPELKSAGAKSFHGRLRTWIRKRELEKIMLHVDDDVVIDLGGKKLLGKKEFSRFWGFTKEASESLESYFWIWAGTLVDAGPAEYQKGLDDRLIYPFMKPDWAARSNKAYRVALSPDTRIYAGPERNAPVLARIDREPVWSEEDAMYGLPELAGWSSVRTAGGIYGFISHEDSIVPEDDSLEFVSRSGKWLLQYCVVREY